MDFRAAFDNFDETLFGGKLTLEHDINKSNSFASITRGYKAGGANIYQIFIDPAIPDLRYRNLWNLN